MTDSTKTYVVTASAIGVPVRVDPRTGIDIVQYYSQTEEVELTAEQADRLLKLNAVRDPAEKSAEEAEREQAAAEESAQLTKKQQLQVRAAELGLAFEDKTTIAQLEAMIAEKEEALRSNKDQTGASGENPGD